MKNTETSRGTKTSRRRRNPAPIILGVAAALLAVYYVVVSLSGVLQTSSKVNVTGGIEPADGDFLTLQMRIQDVDLSNRVIQANVLPIPHGSLVGSKSGEMSRGLRIELSSGGVTTSVVTYPGKSIVDPTSVTLNLDRGDSAYPFDKPFANVHLSVQDDELNEAVPFVLTVENSARPWNLQGELAAPVSEDGKVSLPLSLQGHRDPLSITLVGFYVLAILLTTLMAVVTIGSALIKRQLEFSNVIWLSATMISFPALRSAMPGAPPIGTTLDFIVFFPCVCLIAGMLVWTGAHLLWRESALLRKRHFEDELDDEDYFDEELPEKVNA
ncbi:protein of unknown function [Arthrobacter alpinus]|uniref:DUF4436 domain-containing protein n=1 Tax=Arthrobacter alpinus TaxID=656366 RepID=A0A1H5LIL1_9MICC|nr:DUF4436 family protein [Arthrobacter alpinus]SEE76902.1 protein of unknown function [Arthrobacter alpinus]